MAICAKIFKGDKFVSKKRQLEFNQKEGEAKRRQLKKIKEFAAKVKQVGFTPIMERNKIIAFKGPALSESIKRRIFRNIIEMATNTVYEPGETD